MLTPVRLYLYFTAALEYSLNNPLLVISTTLLIATDLSALAMVEVNQNSILKGGILSRVGFVAANRLSQISV